MSSSFQNIFNSNAYELQVEFHTLGYLKDVFIEN